MNGNEAENEPFDFALFGERERVCERYIQEGKLCFRRRFDGKRWSTEVG